jgi:glycosyltransferase involved in cell wall biosynthesis
VFASVIIPTFNRASLLAPTLDCIAARCRLDRPWEVIVVDNNSTDDTAPIIQRAAASDRRVHYIFEPHQGLSFARKAGIGASRAPLVAFTDDDVRVDEHWVSAMITAFGEHPHADVLGGRVLPLWPTEPPPWLTPEHWAPLALADHGAASFTISKDQPICLVGANLACRRPVFDAVGPFTTTLQRVKNNIGSLEDHEFLLRVLRSGRRAVYDPRILVHAEVQADRLQRRYHRRWHAGHGHFHALLRSEQIERTGRGSLLGVPAHLYRQAAADAIAWVRARAARNSSRAFHHELRLRFFAGFFRTRAREYVQAGRRDGHRLDHQRVAREPLTRHAAAVRQGRE